MKIEDYNTIVQDILANLGDQGHVSEQLNLLQTDYAETQTTLTETQTNLTKTKEDNEKIRQANFNLFSQLGSKPATPATSNPQTEPPELKLEDFIDSKGFVK